MVFLGLQDALRKIGSWAYCNEEPQTGQLNTENVLSVQLWKLEVQNKVVDSATFPLKLVREYLPLPFLVL